MTWRDDLRRVSVGGRQLIGASFRGVPFFVDTAERAGGRRVVPHEFPLRDEPFVDDMGRRARSFRIDGYVVGDDYLAQRDALLAALEDVAGPGELKHPYYGVLRAICANVSVRETRAEGGIATFAIEFTETPAQAPTPTDAVDTAEAVSASADDAITATEAEFVEQYDDEGLPSFALESAELALTSALESLQSGLAPVITATQELAEFTGRIESLTSQASTLVREPESILSDFREAITDLVETIEDSPGEVMDALFEAYLADLGPTVTATTSTRARELANQTALTNALRRIIAIEAARLAPLVAYETIDEATEARDTVASLLDEQAALANDTAYPGIVSLRSEVLRAVPGGTDFARVVSVTRNTAIPSLLLSYQLYGSVENESDVVARNRIRHPGFVAGTLQVLSDD